MQKKLKKRSGRSTIWDLSVFYQNDDDPRIEQDIKRIGTASRRFVARWKNRTDYLNNPLILRKALDDYERWNRLSGVDGDPGYYFWLRTQIDRNNPELKAKFNRVDEFSRKIANEMQFFKLRIARIPKRARKRFLDAPVLARYRHFLELIFNEAAYLLSDSEEKIINLKSNTSYGNWVRMTGDFLAKEERTVLLEDGKKSQKTMAEILSLMNSRKRAVRDTAASAFNDILAKHVDVAEVEINSVLANKKVDDELRGISRPDLPRHLSDDIGSDVVDALRASVSARFDISARYYSVKARLLGLKRLKYHERNVEYGTFSGKYPFAGAVKLVRRVLGSLDPDFLDIFDRFLREERFDAFPRTGKGSGAFCVHHLHSQPTFILLNHTGTLQDVLTLAHELGHGINNELIRPRQHSLDFGTPISTAEVASTFMEDFVLREILRTANDDERLSILMQKLNDMVSTIFRQIACYNFELQLHERFRNTGYVSKTDIGDLFQKHMAAYMGPAVEQSKGSENWWVYWSHIRTFFYVYSYASGLLISKSLQHTIRKDRHAIASVKTFLSAGLSSSPADIFSRVGINIHDRLFWEEGLEEISELLDEVEILAKGLGRLKR